MSTTPITLVQHKSTLISVKHKVRLKVKAMGKSVMQISEQGYMEIHANVEILQM